MKLNDDNFILHAMRVYDNIQCHSVQEFDEDLKRFLYVRKLLSRFTKYGELRERLILNHIIILFNLFGDFAANMLFFKLEEEFWPALSTFLVYLDRLPDEINGIKTSNIGLDDSIIEVLRKI